MGFTALVEPQVILERPLVTFNFIAENIRCGVIPPLDRVTSPNLAWDVHKSYQFETKLRRLGRFCCFDPS